MSGAGGAAAIAAWVEKMIVFAVVQQSTKLDTKDEAVIDLVEVYDPEAVNAGVARFFFYHCVHSLVPAREAVAVARGILDNGVVSQPHSSSSFV